MADDVRGELAKGLEGRLTEAQIDYLLNEVMAITKRVYADFACKECGKKQRQQVDIPDARAVTSSLTELMNQSWGRPTESRQETEIVVNRSVYLVCEHGHPCQECEAGHGGPDPDIPGE